MTSQLQMWRANRPGIKDDAVAMEIGQDDKTSLDSHKAAEDGHLRAW